MNLEAQIQPILRKESFPAARDKIKVATLRSLNRVEVQICSVLFKEKITNVWKLETIQTLPWAS